jgi:hypothetical protein
MSHKIQVATWWRLVVLMLVALLVIAACSTPAAAPTPTPVAMPEVTVEVSDAGISAPDEVPAGLVAVTINNSTQAPTGPIFARLNEGVSQEQFMEALMADESGMAAISLVTLLGGAQAEAGKSVRTVFDLKPGNHIALGFGEGPPQLANFTVAAGSGVAPAAPAAAVNAELLDFQFALPDQIKAGVQTWQIENKGGQWHEMVVVKLNEGVTADDLMAMMMSGEEPDGPPPFEQVAFWAPMSAGERAWMDVDLPAGEYTVLCFLPDFASDPPKSHLEHGMVRTLTVTQ